MKTLEISPKVGIDGAFQLYCPELKALKVVREDELHEQIRAFAAELTDNKTEDLEFNVNTYFTIVMTDVNH